MLLHSICASALITDITKYKGHTKVIVMTKAVILHIEITCQPSEIWNPIKLNINMQNFISVTSCVLAASAVGAALQGDCQSRWGSTKIGQFNCCCQTWRERQSPTKLLQADDLDTKEGSASSCSISNLAFPIRTCEELLLFVGLSVQHRFLNNYSTDFHEILLYSGSTRY